MDPQATTGYKLLELVFELAEMFRYRVVPSVQRRGNETI